MGAMSLQELVENYVDDDDCYSTIPPYFTANLYALPSDKDHVMRNDESLFELSDEEEEVESKCPAASKKREREIASESTGGVVKSSWPEVVGWSGEAAAEQIEKDNGNVVPIVVKVKPEEIASVSNKVRPNIVKIFVDDYGLVIQPPIAG